MTNQPASTARLSFIDNGDSDLAFEVFFRSKSAQEVKEDIEEILQSSSLQKALEDTFENRDSSVVNVRKLALKSLGLQSGERSLCLNGRVLKVFQFKMKKALIHKKYRLLKNGPVH